MSRSLRPGQIGAWGPITFLLALGWLTSAARGDLLYFAKGGEIQSPAVIEGDRVTIELPDAKPVFRRADFRKIVSGFDPEREVVERFRAARLAGPAERAAAIWWAVENGLIDQAVAEIREFHRVDRGHTWNARMCAALDRLAAPCEDPEITRFRGALGVSMSTARGPHVFLLHQREEHEAAARVSLLEKVVTGFYLFFAAQGIELKTPHQRLVTAWFNERDDYLAFLRSQDAAVFSTTRGYYHPTWNAVVAYDGRSSELQRTGREAVASRRREIEQFRETTRRLPPRARLRVTLTGESSRTLAKHEALELADRLERDLLRQELLLDLERRSIDEGTAAHEMIHLVAANSGLLPRHDSFPRWLQEGLAMQFELMRGGRWTGISRAHDLRLPDWRRIQPPPALEPLVRDLGYNRGYQRDAYAQAWALVYYLRVRHASSFLTFLDWLRSPDAALSELPAGDRYITAFRRAFGSDLESLQREWHRFMSTVRTPLEQHVPDEISVEAPLRPSSLPSPPHRSVLNTEGR